ncbi:AHH domain-containing protein [uncultured Dokdonia sp.]|uniref:AHH domain-containing protein n=1 Tax=uncultured Dokdonia sp. TaxID=575653 RepID=UPI00260E9155|nr:AHH domain-containing protein [uncultured Dokdonia sp.]
MYEFKPRSKVVPQLKAVKPTSKIKPDAEIEKEKKESSVQSDIQTPEKTDGINSVGNLDTTNGIQDTTTSSETGGDAFQQLIAKDPITQILENDPITQLLDNDPFIQLVNTTNAPKNKLAEKTKATTEANKIKEEEVPAIEKAQELKEKKSAQDKPKLKIESASPEAAIGSVTKLPPLQMFNAMNEASAVAAQAQKNQLNKVQDGMEEITIPTGIDATSEANQPTPKVVAKGKTPTIKTPTTAKKVAASKETKSLDKATKKAPLGKVTTKRGAFIKDIQKSRKNLGNVHTAAQSDLGVQPITNFDEASNPAQIQANNAKAQQSVGNELGNAQKATTQDFGESGMFPKKASKKAKITIKTALTEQRQSLLSEHTEMPSFDDAETANINQELQARYQGEIAAAEQDMQMAGTDKDQNIATEKNKHHQDMMAATEEAKATQRLERNKGQKEVVNQKENWQAENQKIKEDASIQLAKEQTKNEASITKKQAEGNKQIADTYAKADKDIAAKTKKADEEVAQQEKEGVEKEEKGWFDSAIDWVSDQFDKIKKAVNFIFDKLRAAIKSLVNWAKEKASGIINAVRDFAIKAVKAFGEIAKSVVSAALFMFPETAKKFNAFIDKKVAQTIEVINKVADALEKTVHALLDAVGRVIDAVLAVYQKVMNAVLDVLEAITVGALKLIQKIGWLGSAAKESPDHFFPQMASELLGQDVEEPLENEIPKVFGLTMDDVKKNDLLAAQGGGIETTIPTTNDIDDSIFDKESYVASDFDVPVQDDLQLNDALLAEIAAMPDGVPVEIGSTTADTNGIAAIKAGNTAETEVSSDTTATQTPFITTEYINSLTPKDKEESGWVGPYKSVKARASGAAGAMLDAVKLWWAENKIGIIAALVLGVAGLIAANILTGGAILAALPLLLNILSVFFAADALFQLGKHFKNYLSKAWDNDIKGGAKSMARGLAILIIELVFALMFGAKGVFKAAKAGLKTAKGGLKTTQKAIVKGTKGFVKGQVKNGKRLLAVTRNGSRRAVKNGKIVLQGVKRGSVKGAKSLKSAGRVLLKRLGFDRFRITRSGKRFKLEGHINPWVLLASGEVKHVDKDKIKGAKIGDEITVDGTRGRLIGTKDIEINSPLGKDIDNSGFSGGRNVRDTAAQTLEENKKIFNRIDEIDADETLDIIQKKKKIKNKLKAPSSKALNKLKSAIKKDIRERRKKGLLPEEAFPSKYEAHHVVPKEMEIEFGKVFDELGINLDDAFNGTMLPPVKEFDIVIENARKTLNSSEVPIDFWKRAKHQTHPKYNEIIRKDLSDFFNGFNNLSKADKLIIKEEFLLYIKETKMTLSSLTNEDTIRVLN